VSTQTAAFLAAYLLSVRGVKDFRRTACCAKSPSRRTHRRGLMPIAGGGLQ
jgi:hypothetical protein